MWVMPDLSFTAEIIEWRGPSPFYFAPLPPEMADRIRAIATQLSYGWGVIPVAAMIHGVAFRTSLIPRDGTYLLPLKDSVRRSAAVRLGDPVEVELSFAAPKL